MVIKNICKETVDFFKRVHTQYGCLVSVAGALASSANFKRDDDAAKARKSYKIERTISPLDYDVLYNGGIIEIPSRKIVSREEMEKNLNTRTRMELELSSLSTIRGNPSNTIEIYKRTYLPSKKEAPFYRDLYEGKKHGNRH